jgi:hypothetical protein
VRVPGPPQMPMPSSSMRNHRGGGGGGGGIAAAGMTIIYCILENMTTVVAFMDSSPLSSFRICLFIIFIFVYIFILNFILIFSPAM